MKKFLKKYQFVIILTLLLIVLCIGPKLVFAATTSKLNFCQYRGTRRAFKILGLVINFIKILVPIILIITGIMSLSKTIFSGKSEDFTASLTLLVRKCIAGIVIFLLPTVINYAFDSLIGYNDASFTACTRCMLTPNNCQIPDEDPDTYTD